MIYLAIFASFLVLRFVRLQRLYPLLLVGLFLFSAFRFEVGCDWTGYINQFQLSYYTTFSEILTKREPLFSGLYVFQNWLQLPYPWINVFSSLIFFTGVHFLARRQPHPLSFLILLFPILIVGLPMSGIRQGAAVGAMCLAYLAFVDRKLLRFTLLVVLASGLHASAIVFLFLVPLVHGEFSKWRIATTLLLAIPGAYVLFTGESANLAASRYINTDIDAAGAMFRVGMIALSGFFYTFFLRRKWAGRFPRDFKFVSIMSMIMMAIVLLLPFSTVIADRLGYYFVPVQAIIFARLPFLPFRSLKGVVVASPYLALLATFAVWTSLSGHFQKCYLPYQTWLLGFPQETVFFY